MVESTISGDLTIANSSFTEGYPPLFVPIKADHLLKFRLSGCKDLLEPGALARQGLLGYEEYQAYNIRIR